MNAGKTSGSLWALVALVALGAAFVLGMYALTDTAGRPALLGDLSPLLIGVVAGVPGVLAAMRGEQIKRDHGAKLDTIQHQTNGALRASVADIVGQALDERGMRPTRRRTDKPAAADSDSGEVAQP